MPLLERLFASKEVKAALGVIDECDLIFSSDSLHGDSFKIIKDELVPNIYKYSEMLKKHIKEGFPLRSFIYNAIACIAQDHLMSGQYYMYRGVLSQIGPGPELFKIFNKSLDLLIKEGNLTNEDADQWKSDVCKRISEVG